MAFLSVFSLPSFRRFLAAAAAFFASSLWGVESEFPRDLGVKLPLARGTEPESVTEFPRERGVRLPAARGVRGGSPGTAAFVDLGDSLGTIAGTCFVTLSFFAT